MPTGIIAVLTFGIMAIRRGVDWPLAIVAMVLGDRSDGTLAEEPINMAGNIMDKLWAVVAQIWNTSTSGGDSPAAFMFHAAQVTGIVG